MVIDRDFDLTIGGVNYGQEGVWAKMRRQLHSESPSNYFGYSDVRLDESLERPRIADGEDGRHEVFVEIQEILNDNPFFASFRVLEDDNLHAEHVRGLLLTKDGTLRYDKAFVANAD